MDINKLFQFGAETAKHLFERQGYLLPMWVGVDERGHHQPLLLTKMDDKDAVAEGVKEFLKEKKIVAYVSMIECWIYVGDKMPPEIKEGRSLEHNQDRREGVHLLAEDKDGKSVSGGYFILRPEHSKATLSPLKMHPKASKAVGRFVSMFA